MKIAVEPKLKRADYSLDTTRLLNPKTHVLVYIFSILRGMKGGEVMEVRSKSPFILSPNFHKEYEAEIQLSGESYRTMIQKKAA